jgi:hypothetical protein
MQTFDKNKIRPDQKNQRCFSDSSGWLQMPYHKYNAEKWKELQIIYINNKSKRIQSIGRIKNFTILE